jgi:biopolymer transport protein ExbD
MTLARPVRRTARISLVPLIDVLFILLVYFMVTSVYLDLDMIPVVEQNDGVAGPQTLEPGSTLVVRIDASGDAVFRGRAVDSAALEVLSVGRHRVIVLASPASPLSGLVDTLDMLTQAGVTGVELVRLEAQP